MQVIILMGSDSDLEQVKPCVEILKEFDIPRQVRVLSAHRTPSELHEFIDQVDQDSSVYICAAGGAAHLAGVVASLTSKPVIGIPILTSTLGGADSLYSTVQMPGGVPVATMGIGKAGAKNAGLFAVQVLSLSETGLAAKYQNYRKEMAKTVSQKNEKLQKRLIEDSLI